MIERLIRSFLEWFCPRFLPVYLVPRDDGKPYLSRYYVLGVGRGDENSSGVRSNGLTSRLPFNVFAHKFHSSDASDDLHSHPWGFSVSLILTGGYSEERVLQVDPCTAAVHMGRPCPNHPDPIVRRTFPPFSVNVIRANDFHRADLLDPKRGAWTLFFAGKRRQDWGFLNRNTYEFRPWHAVKNIKKRIAK